ncbi:MAG: hypothetical protein ACE5IM_13305, partial [Nitrospinota bacterium]
RVSHAYLFSGPEGIGKKLFAEEFAKLLNCSAPPAVAAGGDGKSGGGGGDRGGGERVPTPVLNRAALGPGETVEGPAVVEDEWSVTLVPPGQKLTVDGRGNLLIEVKP